jgi:hypothetical protein
MENIIHAFCANCQAEKPHAVSVQNTNGEIILTCDCGRFIKLAPETSPEAAQEMLAEHKTANEGQVSMEKFEDAANKIVEAFQAADAEQPQE